MESEGVLSVSSKIYEMDWSSVEKLGIEVFGQFVDAAFCFLTETNKGDLLSTKTEEIAKEADLDTDSAKQMLKSLICVATGGIKQNQTAAQFQADLKKSGLSDEKIALFARKWESHHSAISKLFSQTLTVNRLVDMEWKFGVTAASSESNRIGHTFLQLKLVVNNCDRLENVYMELTLPQFYAFLHEMERAKASMEYFR